MLDQRSEKRELVKLYLQFFLFVLLVCATVMLFALSATNHVPYILGPLAFVFLAGCCWVISPKGVREFLSSSLIMLGVVDLLGIFVQTTGQRIIVFETGFGAVVIVAVCYLIYRYIRS